MSQVHLRNHLALGRHVPGILAMKSRLAPWQVVEDLRLFGEPACLVSTRIKSWFGLRGDLGWEQR